MTAPAGAAAELAADALWQAGAVAVEERSSPGAGGGSVVLVAGTASGEGTDALVAAVAGRWPVEVVDVDLGAALDAWRPHARAVTVGPLTIRPPWVDLPDPSDPPDSADAAAETGGGTIDVVVDPGRSFGSGSHASTRLALAALVAAGPAGAGHVVDVGCGSGVLAIAALLLGARAATGIDVDPEARSATTANAERNGVADRLSVRPGIPTGEGGELVVANILAPVLIVQAPAVAALVRPGGQLVLAGFLDEQRDQVRAAYPAFVVAYETGEDGWACLTLRRPQRLRR